jgi:hypothetical protein
MAESQCVGYPRSETGSFLEVFGVARPLDRDPGRRALDLAEIGGLSRAPIHVDRVIRALPQELTAVGFQMADEVPAASPRQPERLTNHVLPVNGFLRQCTIGLENKLNGLDQIGASFLQRRTLGVGTWKLLDEADVAERHLLKDGGQFWHGLNLVSMPS